MTRGQIKALRATLLSRVGEELAPQLKARKRLHDSAREDYYAEVNRLSMEVLKRKRWKAVNISSSATFSSNENHSGGIHVSVYQTLTPAQTKRLRKLQEAIPDHPNAITSRVNAKVEVVINEVIAIDAPAKSLRIKSLVSQVVKALLARSK